MRRIPCNGDCCSPELVKLDSPERVNLASPNRANAGHVDACRKNRPGRTALAGGNARVRNTRCPAQRRPHSTGQERATGPIGLRRRAGRHQWLIGAWKDISRLANGRKTVHAQAGEHVPRTIERISDSVH